MKIIYFLAHSNNIGGAMKVLLTQAHLCQMNGNNVKIIIQRNNETNDISAIEFLCQNYLLSYETADFKVATCLEEIDIIDAISKYEALYRIIAEYNPEIIHSVQINTAVELAAEKARIPHVMSVYQLSNEMFQFKWTDIFPQYHMCDSFYYSDKWKKGLSITSRCIRVAYENKMQSTEAKKNSFKYEFINIATFAEHKQQLKIIQFIKDCVERGENVHINFLGDCNGWYGDLCREYIEAHGLEEHISIIGRTLDVENYLCKADLMIHASTVESYPGVIVEAMANRIPVATTRVAGIPELGRDGENLFFIKGFDSEDIYDTYLVFDKYVKNSKIENLKECAYRLYQKEHSYDAVYRSLYNYYTYITNDYHERKNSFELINNILVHIAKNIDIEKVSFLTKERIWYLFHLKKMIKRRGKGRCLIWGAGKNGNIAIEWCSIVGLEIIGYIDNNKVGYYMSYPIFSPSNFEKLNADLIIISVSDIIERQRIMRFLEDRGYIRNRDYILMLNDPCLYTGKKTCVESEL